MVLRILWASGGATAREVHNRLAEVEQRDTTYSTTVKMLAVMLKKGLVKRDENAQPHVYRSAISQSSTSGATCPSILKTLSVTIHVRW